MRKSVAYLDIRKLRLIRAEQAIPDHQNAAKIPVDVLGIAGVVDPMGDPVRRATCCRFACRAPAIHDGLCERHAAQAEVQRQLRGR